MAHFKPPPPCYVAVRIRGNGEVIKREEFDQRKEAAEAARQARLNKKPKKLASQGKAVDDHVMLQVGTWSLLVMGELHPAPLFIFCCDDKYVCGEQVYSSE